MKNKENCGFRVISDLPETLPVLQSTVHRFADLFAEFLAEIAEEDDNHD